MRSTGVKQILKVMDMHTGLTERLRKSMCAKTVEQYQSIEGSKRQVLKEMEKFAGRGWKLQSFGWSNGLQGGWYALMIRTMRLV